MSLDKTYQTLVKSQRSDATDVLVSGVRIGDVDTQNRCIESLARRTDRRSHDALISLWGEYTVRIESVLDGLETDFFKTVAARLAEISVDGKNGGKESGEAYGELVEMAVRFRINTALTPLIELSLNHPDTAFRDTCLDGVLRLAQYWGHQARRNYPHLRQTPTLERQRLDTTARLLEIANHFLSHRCEGLLDALLALSTWSDAAIRSVLQTDTPCRAIILRRMRHSRHSSVLELLAGFVQRRSIPDEVLPIMLQRDEDSYREMLLEAISSSPSPTTINNLREFGLPDCLRGGIPMLRVLGLDRDAAVAHAYTAAMPSNPETLAVLLEICDRQSGRESGRESEHESEFKDGSEVDGAIVISMERCDRPNMDFWLRGLRSPIMDDPARASFQDSLSTDDLAAMICTRLIALSQDDDPSMAASMAASMAGRANELLETFTIQNALPAFAKLSVEQRLRLGRALMQVDSSTLEVVGDGLRHAVMQKRLEAIAFAQTLGLVDLMVDPIAKIAREDHQTARLAATAALGAAHGESSINILRELSNCQLGSIRDVADECLERRGFGKPAGDLDQGDVDETVSTQLKGASS